MDTPERARVRQVLDELKPVLSSFLSGLGLLPGTVAGTGQRREQDVQALLRRVLDCWDAALSERLPRVARTYVHELIDVRNRWAHEEPFSDRDVRRARDTADQLVFVLKRSSAPRDVAEPLERAMAPDQPARSQREVMRDIHRRYGQDRDRVVREYAAAERRGVVERKRNSRGLSPEDYATALLADGEKKGWL